MRKRRTAGTLLLLAGVLAALVAWSVSAASAATKAAARSTVAQAQTWTVVGTGTIGGGGESVATARTPSTASLHVNRPIPSKAGGAVLSSLSVAALASSPYPTVKATPISPLAPPSLGTQGLNAFDNNNVNGFDLEPPDQGLCAGGGYVIEPINDVVAVYDESDLTTQLAGPSDLNSFFGTTMNLSDPKCYYDPASGQFFLSILEYNNALTQTGLYLAVTQGTDPTGTWNIYFHDTTTDGCPAGNDCLPDQPLLGANADTVFLSVNNFETTDGGFFEGANIYAISKAQLESGSPAFYQFIDLGNISAPGCGTACWYSVQPAFSDSASQWDLKRGGTAYFLSALDFFGSGDNRITAWALTNTGSITTGFPATTLYSTTIRSQKYAQPAFTPGFYFSPLSPQKDDGLIPLGSSSPTDANPGYGVTSAQGITANDDRMNQVMYSRGILWAGVNTGVLQKQVRSAPAYHNGIAWFGVSPAFNKLGLFLPRMVRQGYTSPYQADALFPSIGVTDRGRGVLTYTLTGNDYYPSSAYSPFNSKLATGGADNVVNVAMAGQGSQDGFTEYQPLVGTMPRPRWGDYSAAVADGGTVFFANEYIQFPNCSVAVYQGDVTCGGTRSQFANWGTSLVQLTP